MSFLLFLTSWSCVCLFFSSSSSQDLVIPDIRFRRAYQNVDKEAIKQMFDQYDTDKSGTITLDEFEGLLNKIGVAPLKNPMKRGSASKDAEKGSMRDA